MTTFIFDFDDTLIVSRADRALRLVSAIRSFGHAADQRRLSDAWGQPFRDMVLQIAPTLEGEFSSFLSFYAGQLTRAAPRACPGVIEAIPILGATCSLFVHTASHGLLVRTDLHTLGLLQHFDFVCGSDWQVSPKPSLGSLQSLLTLIDSVGQPRDGVFYVGDTASDAAIAESAGIQFIGAAFSEPAHSALSVLASGIRRISDMRELLTKA